MAMISPAPALPFPSIGPPSAGPVRMAAAPAARAIRADRIPRADRRPRDASPLAAPMGYRRSASWPCRDADPIHRVRFTGPRRWSYSLVQSKGPRDGDGIARDRLRLARVADGDQAAFTAIVAEETPRLLRFVASILGSGQAEAEEIVQEALVRLWQQADRLAARRAHRHLAAPRHLPPCHRRHSSPPAVGGDRDGRGHARGFRAGAGDPADPRRGRDRRCAPRSRHCRNGSGRRSCSAISRALARPRRRV